MTFVLAVLALVAMWVAVPIPPRAPPSVETWCFPHGTEGVGVYFLCPDNAPKDRAA